MTDALREETGCRGGWRKYAHNPLIGQDNDFLFDNCVIHEGACYRMYFSWRNHYAIATCESSDGINWGEPKVILEPRDDIDWEDDVNRPAVVVKNGLYHMWYSGQTAGVEFPSTRWTDVYLEASRNENGTSSIGYAYSKDGYHWVRREQPVLMAEHTWEKQSLMCPTVLWDADKEIFRVWYSGGGWFEPDAIGYAESADGLNWHKPHATPIFMSNASELWECSRVAGQDIVQYNGWYYMFYIGYEDMFKSRIGLARSKDGISNWERHPDNPIISAGLPGAWDSESIYKPFVCVDEVNDRWLMWFNARSGTTERIGLAIHKGLNLGF